MAQQRQGWDPLHYHHNSNGRSHIGNRASTKLNRYRRSSRSGRFSIAAVAVFLALALCVTVLVYFYISEDDREMNNHAKDDLKNDFDSNVSHAKSNSGLMFGHGSVAHGRDSRYWDKDDRRRDEAYNVDGTGNTNLVTDDESTDKSHISLKANDPHKKYYGEKSGHNSDLKGVGLYNEAGRNELKVYEEKYEDSLKDTGSLNSESGNRNQVSHDDSLKVQADADDEYDDSIEMHDVHMEDYNGTGNEKENKSGGSKYGSKSHDLHKIKTRYQSDEKVVDDLSTDLAERRLSLNSKLDNKGSRHGGFIDDQATKISRPENKRKRKRRKFSGSCEMKFLNSTSQLVEPLEGRKFARFSLQYKEVEEKPIGEEAWEPRFGGHQTLEEREQSFVAHDQKINCGFVKGPKGYPSTGFDLAEDDINYISRCHIAVVSCIFGNSDRIRSPTSNKINRLSRKNVCFVMFVDEATQQKILSEGQVTGFWKLVVVKNLPFSDMRRVGKIPKLLLHRLFPSARYSIWLDSKLRLKFDPLLILEYFLWRKGNEYAISNHYDRHCVWEEVAQNKKLNKYNHTVIDEQFAFYQADGLKRFNASDPNKLLSSNVPEGSFIVRAHTSMSNLFSCLWFNEVDRFAPRDQLSFAFTYQKLRRMNPDKPFHLNMFKDCERRFVTKLYRHRTRNIQAIE